MHLGATELLPPIPPAAVRFVRAPPPGAVESIVPYRVLVDVALAVDVAICTNNANKSNEWLL